jgi:hypothetical protein
MGLPLYVGSLCGRSGVSFRFNNINSCDLVGLKMAPGSIDEIYKAVCPYATMASNAIS